MKQSRRIRTPRTETGAVRPVARAIRVMAIALIMMCVSLLGAMSPNFAWADEGVQEPAHAKSLVDNGDGTYTVNLDVAGSVSEESRDRGPVDVVLVMDSSGSMKGSRWDTAKSAASALANKLLSDNADGAIQMAVIDFDTTASVMNFNSGWWGNRRNWTTSAQEVTNSFNLMSPSGGTNWEDALQEANALSSGRSGAKKYIIFMSDGDPTYRISSVQTGDKPWNKDEDDDGGWFQPSGVHGNGNNDPYHANYNSAVNEANKRNGATLYVVETANTNTMGQFAEDTQGQYFNGKTTSDLTASFDAIIQQITRSTAFGHVKITDTLSQWAEFAAVTNGAVNATDEPSFTYQISNDGGETFLAWDGAPAATYENGTITWDLSSLAALNNGTVYRIGFTIRANQKAYDDAATDNPQTNGAVMEDGETPADNNGKEVAEGNQPVGYFSNGEAKLSYAIATRESQEGDWEYSDEKESNYNKPVMEVSPSKLTLSKIWDDNGLDHSGDNVTVQIKQEDADYKTVVLDSGNNWSAEVKVAAGWEGHTYTASESNVPENYKVSVDPQQGVSLIGSGVQTGQITVTNTLAAGDLSITKQVEDVTNGSAPTDASFTIQVKADEAAGKTYAIEGYGTESTVSFNRDGLLELDGITKGQTVTIKNLPEGTEFEVTEPKDKMPARFELKGITDNSGDEKDGKGSIEAKKTASVTLDNEYQGLCLRIYKYEITDGNESPLSGASFKVTGVNNYSKDGVTDSSGFTSFSGLGNGTYTISETRVPAGFTQAPERTLVISGNSATLSYVDSTGATQTSTMDAVDGIFSIEIENSKVASLPTTGGSGTVLISAVGVSMVAAAGYFLIRRFKLSR